MKLLYMRHNYAPFLNRWRYKKYVLHKGFVHIFLSHASDYRSIHIHIESICNMYNVHTNPRKQTVLNLTDEIMQRAIDKY